MSLVSVAVLVLASTAQAVPIFGVTATSSVADLPGFSALSDTVDFTNLSGSMLSDITTNGFGWFASGPVQLPVINTYSLNGNFLLSQLGFWNAATPDPTPLGNNAFGFRDVLIETSTDNLSYVPVVGGTITAGVHTFAIANDTSGNSAEILGFNPVVASFVRFSVLTDYNGAGFPGYQAVIFDGLAISSSVPELEARGAIMPFCFLASLCLVGVTKRTARVA